MTMNQVIPFKTIDIAEPVITKCKHGVYIPERLREQGISDGCTVCMTEVPALDRRYAMVTPSKLQLPKDLDSLVKLWRQTDSNEAYESIYFALQNVARGIAKQRFQGHPDIPDYYDAAHDAAVHCQLNLNQFKGQSKAITWAHGVIDNYLTNWVTRDINCDTVFLDVDGAVDVPDTRPLPDEKLFLKEIKKQLTPEELQLFEMKADGATFEEIGLSFGITKQSTQERWVKLTMKIKRLGTVKNAGTSPALTSPLGLRSIPS
jgi:DNA-directed RNA polymerase specialized sigma24 family protein